MFSALAPAKLNLALHITGKRPDGYHLMESLVAFANIGDVVRVTASDAFSLHVTGKFAEDAGQTHENLIWKAAHLLAGALEIISPYGAVTLEKHLPVGAGLGGGSMDAVVACRLLAKLWGHIVPDATLAKLLLPLGADMPMCVTGVPLIAHGIGEIITPIHDFPQLHAVLCWPNRTLPTRDVYARYTHEERALAPLETLIASTQGDSDALIQRLEFSRNMLQRAAIACVPEVAELLLAMEMHPTRPLVRMSGSGACCVAYFTNRSAAENLAATLRSFYPHWWVEMAKL
jgi:4-diphosphocytidyl-2-C-methyl-D-erythritol kinase